MSPLKVTYSFTLEPSEEYGQIVKFNLNEGNSPVGLYVSRKGLALNIPGSVLKVLQKKGDDSMLTFNWMEVMAIIDGLKLYEELNSKRLHKKRALLSRLSERVWNWYDFEAKEPTRFITFFILMIILVFTPMILSRIWLVIGGFSIMSLLLAWRIYTHSYIISSSEEKKEDAE